MAPAKGKIKTPKHRLDYINGWTVRNKEKAAAYKKKYHWNLRDGLLKAYAVDPNKIACAKCGFSDKRALQIDHIDGGGSKQYKELKARGWSVYLWIKRNGYPPGYQILCANCNWIKRCENMEYGAPGPDIL